VPSATTEFLIVIERLGYVVAGPFKINKNAKGGNQNRVAKTSLSIRSIPAHQLGYHLDTYPYIIMYYIR